jgi:hypothetical protein
MQIQSSLGCVTLALVLASTFPSAYAQAPQPQEDRSVGSAAPGGVRSPPSEALISDEQVRKAVADLSRVSDVEAEKPSLPAEAWLARDKADADKEISGLLSELSDLLGSSNSVRYWREMRERQKELADKRNEIDKLTLDADLDPAKRAALAKKIEAARSAAEELRKSAEAAKQAANQALEKAGIDLNQGQLDALAATVVGDDIVDLVSRVTTLATVLERMQESVSKGTGSPDMQRRYYGVVVVVQKVTLSLQKRYLARIDEKYLPYVEDVVATMSRAMAEANGLKRTETNSDRMRVLDANLKAQRLTSDTARLYRQHLEAQRSYARNAIRESERNLNVAINTRDTVATSLDLLANIDASQDLFRVIQLLRLPSIQPFNSDEVQRAFERLTVQMRAS